MSSSMAWGLTASQWSRTEEPQTRIINMNRLGRVLTEPLDPPVKVLFVYNCNPVATMPDQQRVLQGLAREDLFTVVFDQVFTDTAYFADIVLPATTFLENYDFSKSYGPLSLLLGRPVVDPVGEARSNADVFGALAERLDVLEAGEPSTELDLLLDVMRGLPPHVFVPIEQGRGGDAPWDGRPIQFVDVFPRTPDQKAHLFPEALEREAPLGLYRYQPDPATDAYPLALISPASDRTVSSTLGELSRPEVKLLMHPQDAFARGLADNDPVRIWNTLGEVRCHVQVGAWIRPGTVMLPKGLWRKSTSNGLTANALAPDTLTDLGGGACFNDARVQVEKR
jgi:anaerobic selenocysteine-containing dehydrogenase